MALVDAQALGEYLRLLGGKSQPEYVAEVATTASTYVQAYCSRLRPGDPVPPVVSRVAQALAVRLAANPRGIRSVSAEGQSTDLPPIALSYFEQVLLNPYRRRTA